MENINQLAAGLLRDYAADVAARVVRTDFEMLGQIAAELIAAKERGGHGFYGRERRQRRYGLAHVQRSGQGLPGARPRGVQGPVLGGLFAHYDLFGQRFFL